MLNLSSAWDARTGFSPHKPLIAWRDHASHAKARRAWTRGLSSAALKDYEPTLAERVTQLVDLARRHEGKPTDVAELFKRFS